MGFRVYRANDKVYRECRAQGVEALHRARGCMV